jgi:putative SOS response-associated peptidase YedK
MAVEIAMCGRYVRRGDKQKIAEWFHAEANPAELAMPDADYNVSPTTHQPIIRQSRETEQREMVLARWGLVPFFTNDLKDIKGLSTINARAETIATAKTWREPLKKRRCLIPVNAFYEWPKRESHRSSRTHSSWRTASLSPLLAYGTVGKTLRAIGFNHSPS